MGYARILQSKMLLLLFVAWVIRKKRVGSLLLVSCCLDLQLGGVQENQGSSLWVIQLTLSWSDQRLGEGIWIVYHFLFGSYFFFPRRKTRQSQEIRQLFESGRRGRRMESEVQWMTGDGRVDGDGKRRKERKEASFGGLGLVAVSFEDFPKSCA